MESELITFEQLMGAFDLGRSLCNRRIYERLVDAMRGNVTPVIGAGLSCWAEYPLWASLLAGLAGKEEDNPTREAVQKYLNKNKFEKAASLLEKHFCHNAFLRAVADEYSPHKLDTHTRPPYQRLLPELFHGPIVTTNYDVSLEKLFNVHDIAIPEDNYHELKLKSKITNYERVVVKLHGSIDDPSHIILTEKRYNETYGKRAAHPDMTLPLPDALHDLFRAAPTLFLGCGLGPDRTGAVLKACVGNNGFAVLELPEETCNKDDPFHPTLRNENGIIPALQKRRKQIDELKLQPIWYPYQHHEAVGVLIEHIAAELGIKSDTEKKAMSGAAQEATTSYAMRPCIGRDDIATTVAEGILDKDQPIIVVHGVAGIGKTEICKAAYQRIKDVEPSFSMPFIDLAGTDTIIEFYQKISEGLGIHSERISSENIDDLLAAIRTYSEVKPIYVYLDSFEELWIPLSSEAQRTLSDNLIKLVSAGLQLLISSQFELPFGKGIPVAELDGSIIVENLPWSAVLELDRTKLFLGVLYRSPRESERNALTRLIADTSGHPLSIILTAIYAKDCSSLETLPSFWQSIVNPIAGDRKNHDCLAKSLALSWSSVRQSQAAMMRWALHANSILPLDEKTFRELRSRLKKHYSDSVWIEGDRILRRLGLTFLNPDGRECMLMSIKKSFPGLDELAKQLSDDAFSTWIDWCGNLLEQGTASLSSNCLEPHRYALEWLPQCFFLSDVCIKAKEYSKLSKLWLNAPFYYQFDIVHSLHLLEELEQHKPDEYTGLAKSMTHYVSILAITDQIKKALEIADFAEELCRSKQDNDTLKDVLISRAEIYRLLGRVNDSESQLYDAKKLCTANDKLRMARILYQMCSIQIERGDLHQAEKALSESEQYFIEENDQLGKADVMRLRADLMKDQEEDALTCLSEALYVYEEAQDEVGQAYVWYRRGQLFSKHTANHTKAMAAFSKASILFRKLHHNRGWVSCLRMCAILSPQPMKAIEAVIQAENSLQSERDFTNLSELLSFHGDFLQKNNQWDGAIHAYEEAANLFRSTHDNEKLAIVLGSLDLCYQKTGNSESAKAAADELCRLLANDSRKNDQ